MRFIALFACLSGLVAYALPSPRYQDSPARDLHAVPVHGHNERHELAARHKRASLRRRKVCRARTTASAGATGSAVTSSSATASASANANEPAAAIAASPSPVVLSVSTSINAQNLAAVSGVRSAPSSPSAPSPPVVSLARGASSTISTSTLPASSAAPVPASASPSPSPSPSSSSGGSTSGRVSVDPSGTDGPFSGHGTWYDVGLGSCGWTDTPDHPIVAVSDLLMNSWPGATANPNNHPLCGKHLQITWGGKTALAKVADTCPGCAIRSLDMSKGLFEEFAGLDVGLLADGQNQDIVWSWVSGDGDLPSVAFTP